jgi:hypothetical protein
MRQFSLLLFYAVVCEAVNSPPSPPLGQWPTANAEVLALDLPYSNFAANYMFYAAAVTKGIYSVSNQEIIVNNYQPSNFNTVLVYFDVISISTDAAYVENDAWEALFCPPNGTLVAGSPACPPLLAALQAQGMPIAGAFFQEQTSPSTWTSALLRNTVDASAVGTWKYSDWGEVICVDILFLDWAQHVQSYSKAFQYGLQKTLNLTENSVEVSDFQASGAGTACIYINILLPSTTSSDSIPNSFQTVQGLFEACGPLANVGCPSKPALVASLRQYGLPLTNAFYNEQQASPPPPAPPRFHPNV